MNGNNTFKFKAVKNDQVTSKVLIVGGGPSVQLHKEAINQFLNVHKDVIVIHASSKNALAFNLITNKQIFCLVGNEGHRMEEVFDGEVFDHYHVQMLW